MGIECAALLRQIEISGSGEKRVRRVEERGRRTCSTNEISKGRKSRRNETAHEIPLVTKVDFNKNGGLPNRLSESLSHKNFVGGKANVPGNKRRCQYDT